MWRSLVARFVRDEEAVGSNPATPTRKQLFRGVFWVGLPAPVPPRAAVGPVRGRDDSDRLGANHYQLFWDINVLPTPLMLRSSDTWLGRGIAQLLDGRDPAPGDGVQRALGRPSKDFTDFARDIAHAVGRR